MIDLVYYNPKLRIYRNGTVERLFKEWIVCKIKANAKGYIETRIDGKNYKVHRLVGFCYLGLDIDNQKILIDHINHQRADNRVENLRIVNNQQNQWNRKDPKGYSYHKSKQKYQAKISVYDKQISLGHFDTEQEARQAYLLAKEKYHN